MNSHWLLEGAERLFYFSTFYISQPDTMKKVTPTLFTYSPFLLPAFLISCSFFSLLRIRSLKSSSEQYTEDIDRMQEELEMVEHQAQVCLEMVRNKEIEITGIKLQEDAMYKKLMEESL